MEPDPAGGPAVATQLVFETPPSDGTAGATLPWIRVAITDDRGAVVTSATAAVTIQLVNNTVGATLSGTLTVGAVDGVAAFDDLAIDKAAAAYALTANTTTLATVESAPFDIGPGAPAELAFRTPPSNVDLDLAIDPAIEVIVLDAWGNAVIDPMDVTLELEANPGNALLHGSTTVSTVHGVATFADVRLDRAAAGYSLQAASAGLASVGSPPFDVVLAFEQLSGSIEDLALQDHTCGLTTAGAVYCWGANFYGQLGNGDRRTDRDRPARAVGDHTFANVATGLGHTCAVTTAGEAYCWGINNEGQLGNGNPGGERDTPAIVQGGHTFTSLVAGVAFTCGLTTDGQAVCWGINDVGQLGNGNGGNSTSLPVTVGGGHTFVSLTRGEHHACGLTTGGSVYCWGANAAGQLGNGNSGTNSDTPVAALGGHTFVHLTAGGYHTCGVTESADAYCWGDNARGQLGDGDLGSDSDTPARVDGGYRFAALAAGTAHTCGLTVGGDAMCWGDNTAGELGHGNNETERGTPVLVQDGNAFVSLAAGSFHTCGVTADRTAYCWGWNEWGQLGDGNVGVDRNTPVAVANP